MTRDSPGTTPLGIYLNDHLAGATGGTLLARRMAASGRYQSDDGTLWRLAEDIARDRATLLDLLAALSIPVRGYKVSRHGPPSGLPGSSPTVTWLPGRRCPTWRSWKCCGWALKARLPGGGPAETGGQRQPTRPGTAGRTPSRAREQTHRRELRARAAERVIGMRRPAGSAASDSEDRTGAVSPGTTRFSPATMTRGPARTRCASISFCATVSPT